jgi:hypothetical protein
MADDKKYDQARILSEEALDASVDGDEEASQAERELRQ